MATASCRRCRGASYRILVEDDHPWAQDIVATRILLDDVRLDIRSICEAGSGEEAIWRARVYKPHAVLMDIKMPGIDGFEAATKLGAAGFLTKDRVATDLVPLLSQALSRPSLVG